MNVLCILLLLIQLWNQGPFKPMFALNIGFLRREIVYFTSMNNILSVRSDLWKLSVLAGSFDDNNDDDDDEKGGADDDDDD